MVECGSITEAQRKILGILLKKSIHGTVDVSVKIFELLSKNVVETMEVNQS